MNNVIWKDIKGYEGYYQVSSHGQVRSLDRTIVRVKNGQTESVPYKGTILEQTENDRGYKTVKFSKGNQEKRFYVHRLVADAFVLNFDSENTQVNHKDENKANNYYDNLEWCTAAYNINYGTRTERTYKPVIAYDDTNTLYFKSMTEAQEHGFNISSVSRCVNGKQKSYKGYQWRLA